MGYYTNKFGYRGLIRRTRVIEENFYVKFDDFYIPIQYGPLIIVEVNYDTHIDPSENARLYKILLSPATKFQQIEDSTPSIVEDSLRVTSTLLVDKGKHVI